MPSSTFDALDAFAAPVTYSTCVPGQACYGTDGTLTTSVSIAAAPTPDLEPSVDPITTTNPSASDSERLALYASPLVPARYRGDTLVREQFDGVPPYPIAGIANDWNPTAVTGRRSDGYSAIPASGTAVASRTPIWFGNFVPTPNDFIRTRWQGSQKTWTRASDLHEREATSTMDMKSRISTPTSLITLAASPRVEWQGSDAMSNPTTAGATTMLDPNATSSTIYSTSSSLSARLLGVKRAVEPKTTPRTSSNDLLQPTTMATHYKQTTGGASLFKPTATTDAATLPKSSQKNDAEVRGSQTGSSPSKEGLGTPGVIMDPYDEDMWAECTVGEPRDRSSRSWPNGENRSNRPPMGGITTGTGDKPGRSGQCSMTDGASALSAIPTKPTVDKWTLAQSRNDGLPAAYATVLPIATNAGAVLSESSPNYYQPSASSYSTRAGSRRPAPSGNNEGNVRSSHGRTPGQRLANIFRHSRNRGHASPNIAEPATESAQGAVEEPATGAGSTELLDPNDLNDPPPDYSSPPSYHSQDQEDDQMGGLHSAEDGDSRSTMEMETFGENQGTTSPQGSGARPLVADNAGDNRPVMERSTSGNAPGRSGGGFAASGGPGSGSGNQIGSASSPSTSDRSDRQARKRTQAVRSEYSNRRRTVNTEKGSVDRETITADSLNALHAHARRSPGGSQSKDDKCERRPRRCRKKKDKKRAKNQPAQDEFECEPEPQIETQGAQPDAIAPYGAPSSQPFSPPETVQKQANTDAAPQQPEYGQTEEAVENPPFVYQQRLATPPYPPKDEQPADHGLDKWEGLPPADRRKLMYNKQLKDMYPDDSSENFYPPLRPASLALTEPDTNRWTVGRLSQDGRNMYTPPGDMSSSISSDVSESKYNPFKQEENRGQSSSKPPKRNRLHRRSNQPPREPPSYADANLDSPRPGPSQAGDADANANAEAFDDEPPGYTGQYHPNQRGRTDVADQRTGVPSPGQWLGNTDSYSATHGYRVPDATLQVNQDLDAQQEFWSRHNQQYRSADRYGVRSGRQRSRSGSRGGSQTGSQSGSEDGFEGAYRSGSPGPVPVANLHRTMPAHDASLDSNMRPTSRHSSRPGSQMRGSPYGMPETLPGHTGADAENARVRTAGGARPVTPGSMDDAVPEEPGEVSRPARPVTPDANSPFRGQTGPRIDRIPGSGFRGNTRGSGSRVYAHDRAAREGDRRPGRGSGSG